jgi:hypothetical protein
MFIGLVFDPHHLSSQKISSYRKRFDPKYLKGTHLQLTLLPPFSFPEEQKTKFYDFVQDLKDLFDGHLHGLSDFTNIEFHGIDFIAGKKSLVGLNPKLPIDLVHCQEAVKDILEEYGIEFKNPKSVQAFRERQEKLGDRDSVSLKSFLTIGRFSYNDELESGLEIARDEFPHAFTLPLVDICLFKNLPHQWVIESSLYKVQRIAGSSEGHLLRWMEY